MHCNALAALAVLLFVILMVVIEKYVQHDEALKAERAAPMRGRKAGMHAPSELVPHVQKNQGFFDILRKYPNADNIDYMVARSMARGMVNSDAA